MMIGYARVSTADQTFDLQIDALEKAGCAKIFTDTASGAKAERKGLEEAISYVRAGDMIVVWRLDRLGRSLQPQGSPHFGQMLNEIEESERGCWIGRMNQEGRVVVGFVPGFGST